MGHEDRIVQIKIDFTTAFKAEISSLYIYISKNDPHTLKSKDSPAKL